MEALRKRLEASDIPKKKQNATEATVTEDYCLSKRSIDSRSSE